MFFASLVFAKVLRLIEEHYQSMDLLQLRQKEVQLCLKIWQGNQEECYQIGAEFMRLFLNAVKIPEFQPICEDLSRHVQGRPLSLHLYERRGAPSNGVNIYVQQLLPVQVERKLEFLLSQAPHPSQSFYLKWFLQSIGVEFGSESESLLVDIVRYIVVNIHPRNEIIFESNVIQRFVLIGYLIQSQSHPIHQSWVLQALFYDWLRYDAEDVSSIMLVEPAMLLMYRSAENNPSVTDMLIEYLFNYINSYLPAKRADFLLSVQRVLKDCQDKGVIKDIKKLINHHKLKPDTQNKLKIMFRADEEVKHLQGQQPLQNQELELQNPSITNQYNVQMADTEDHLDDNFQMFSEGNDDGGNAYSNLIPGTESVK
jgi:integrator complex subunit 3